MNAPQLPPGTVVAGKYQVGACLGYSGSSGTYQAAGADGREVVLKIFDPAIRQRADIMAALEQTYAATNALPQDVAVPLLDAGYDQQTGAPFSVTERIPFPSLAQAAAQRPLTPEEACNVLGMMAHVLDQAHARQLFHHALTPTNLFVGFAQGYGIRITDFGAGLGRTAVPTQEGYALAAPWMAPEQVQGGAPPGGAADVFSTALVIFFALTGRSYWRGCQGALDLAGWQRELMSPRTPPSARALQLGVTLNSAFDGVIGCALSIDPGQRYRSVGELARAFEALVAKAPESQATAAFPAGAAGLNVGGGDYPPPPPPTGGLGAPQNPQLRTTPGMGGGMMQQNPALMTSPTAVLQSHALPPQPPIPGPRQPSMPNIQPQQQGYGPPAHTQQQGNAGYVSTQTPQGGSDLGETAAGRPVDPALLQRRAPTNKLAPVLVGLVALMLLGGAAAAWFFMGKKAPTETTAADSASASASASAAPATTTTASASATASATATASDTAAPPDTAAATADTAAPPADSASATPSAEPAAGATDQEVSFTCDPADCDEIKADDKPLEIGKPMRLTPGKHVILASKAGFVTAKETVVVKAGEKLEKEFKLTARATGPGPVRPCKKVFVKTKCK